MQQGSQDASVYATLQQVTGVLGLALQQVLTILHPHQQQQVHLLQQHAPAQQQQQQEVQADLLPLSSFQPRSLVGPWPQISPTHALLAASAGVVPDHLQLWGLAQTAQLAAGVSTGLTQQPAGLDSATAAAAAAAGQQHVPVGTPAAAGVSTAGAADQPAPTEAFPDLTEDVGGVEQQQEQQHEGQGQEEGQSRPRKQQQQGGTDGQDIVDVPMSPAGGVSQEGEQPSPTAAAPAPAAAAVVSPVPSERITSSSGSSCADSADAEQQMEVEGADAADSAEEAAAAAAGPGAAAAAAVSVRLGDPEVVSGRRSACCTIVRCSQQGGRAGKGRGLEGANAGCHQCPSWMILSLAN